jgi:hypothetical protein
VTQCLRSQPYRVCITENSIDCTARDVAGIPLRVAFDMRGTRVVGPKVAAGVSDMVSFCRCINEFKPLVSGGCSDLINNTRACEAKCKFTMFPRPSRWMLQRFERACTPLLLHDGPHALGANASPLQTMAVLLRAAGRTCTRRAYHQMVKAETAITIRRRCARPSQERLFRFIQVVPLR